MTATPDFNRMNLAAGGTTLHKALADHRVLTSMLDHYMFVIANTADRTAALATADAHVAEQEGLRPVYTILLSDEHLTALHRGPVPATSVTLILNVAVLDAQNNHQPTPTAIKANNAVAVPLDTEHGRMTFILRTSRDLRAGDIYTCGNQAVDGNDTPSGLLLYRALADYDPTTGEVAHHIVTRTWDTASDADKANLTGALTGGPDNLVHRVHHQDRLRERLGLADLATTPSR